jgi:lipooligosaccharide transport system permease protein
MIPLFLFSGTFFPISQLPAWLRPVAYVTPLWHGVALCRGISLGSLTAGDALIHIGYLVAVAAAGLAVGRYTYRRRLHA